MIVFVAGERRAMALDRIGDEQGRLVVFSTVERLDQRLDAMPAEIGHELGQRLVIKAVEQLFDVRFLADIGEQPFAPRRRSEEHTSELQSLMRISYAVCCLKQKDDTNMSQHHKRTSLTQPKYCPY